MKKLSVIIPAFNEENSIEKVIREVFEVKYPAFITEGVEVIVINDCSTDNTLGLLLSIKEQYPDLEVICNEKNMGKGASVRKGYSKASGDVLFVQDADLELSPSDIPRMLVAMKELNVEFVNGSRYMPGVLRPLSTYRRYLVNSLFTFFVSVLIDVKLTDMACGHKLIHRNLLSQITLRESAFGFEAELLLKALRIKKNNIVEIPVKYIPRTINEGKKIRAIDGLKILIAVFKYGVFKRD
ncbi:MAG TPA: glycosyltransferase family 2 protein [Bacteroidales bacterium]|nr:glycosyltransferase family 2 protein [Bacteroidales bacterium]